MDVRAPFFQNIACVLIGVMFLNPIVTTAAELALDAQAGSNAAVTQAANGVPMVNIATPNGSGLSHNKFTDFNVSQQGLILNNSAQALVQTQLGGYVVGNPNLGGPNLTGGAANVILNEVNGGSPSQLKGYTEVAGKSAAVIVANPHGISCDGCGFINTPRATLTTGKPIIENGKLDRFDVEGGQISIEGNGLNARNVSQFDLITRSAQINAELHANQLNVITGRNDVDAANLTATAKADDGSAKPQLAIDSSALGGMYAGAIRLVGTEAGVGVKLAGDMAASAGDIQIDANGQLSVAQATASRDIRLKSESIALTSKAYAGRHVDAQAEQRLSLAQGQSLAARESIKLKGGRLDNQGLIEAGVNSDNSRNLNGDVTLSGNSLRNSGSVIASRGLSAKVDGQLDNRAGTLSAKANSVIKAAALDNREEGVVLSNGTLALDAEQLDNRTGLLASGKALNIKARSSLDNQDGEISSQTQVALEAGSLDNRKGLIAARDAISVQAEQVNNSQEGAISSKGTLTVIGTALDNRNGLILAEQQLLLKGESLDNRTGQISGKADVGVAMTSSLDNSDGGVVQADGQLNVSAAELSNNQQGQIAAKGDVSLAVGGLSQQGGELLSQGMLSLKAQRIDNRQGGLMAGNKGLDIQATERLDNRGGEISTQAKAAIRVKAGSGQAAAELDNSRAGRIIADQGLSLTVQRLLNHSKGVLSGRDSLVLIGDSLDNSNEGTLSSQQLLSVQLTGALQNQAQGALLSGGRLTVRAGSVDNRSGGVLSSAAQLQLEGGALHNQGGRLISDDQLSLTTNRVDNSESGVISAKQALSIATGQLHNHQGGTINSAAALTLNATQLNNHNQGRIAAKGAATLTLTGLDQHAGGELVSERALTLDLQGGTLNNRDKGLIATPGALVLNNLGRVDNSAAGEISSQQSFLLSAQQLNNSAAGRLISGQHLQLQINQALLNNLKGILSAAKLSVAAAQLDNADGGLLTSQNDIHLTLAGKLDNQGRGTVTAGTTLDITSDELDNSNDGLLSSGTTLQLQAGAVNNQDGRMLSRTTLEAQTADLNNRGGVLSSQQALTLRSAAIDNRDNGLITSAAGLTLNATRLDSSRDLGSTGGEVSAKQDLQLTVKQLIQQHGRLIGEAGVRIDFKGGDLDNRAGLLSAKGPLNLLNLGKLDNRDAGEVSSSQSYSLTAKTLDNGNQGRLISAGTLALELADGALRNAEGGLLSGRQGLTVKAGNLDNSALGTLSSREGALKVELQGSQRELNNSGAGALVSKGTLEIEAGNLNNSDKGIVSSESDTHLRLSGALNNSAGGLIDSQGTLTADSGVLNNHAGQISSLQALQLKAGSLDNRAGQLSSNAALNVTLTGQLLNSQKGQMASAGPLVLKAAAFDNQGGSLLSQNSLILTASSLNNANGGTVAARSGLNLLLSGALNNSADGLIHSQLGAVGIQAQSLNNQSGVLSSAQDLTVKLDSQLANQSGRIESLAGNLDLQKASEVDNSDGVLSSLKGWLKLTTAGLFDNDAGTTQAQSLAIEAKGVDNRGGHISALSGDSVIDSGSATFNNQNGGLYAHQLLKVIAGDFNNQGAVQGLGGKVAAGQIDFGLSGALRNSYGIVESSSSLNLAVSSLNNQNGSLRALGSTGNTRIQAASLDNRSGKIETANTDLKLISTGLQNSGGRILHVGTGNFGLSAAHVTGAGGDLSTNGLLTLTADSWTNSDVLQAGQLVLNIGNFTQTASGKLLAGNSFTGSGSNWINHGLLASDGNFSLNLTGAYSGNGQLSSLGDLTVKAASIDLSNSARIAGGGPTQVSATGVLNNLGKLTSASDLTVSGNTLNNRGTLGSGEKLRLVAPTLLNENGLIFSGDDMALLANQVINRKGDIYSLGKLFIAANDSGDLASRFSNLSGTIESIGAMRIAASVLENARETFAIESKKYAARIVHIGCNDCSGDKEDVLFRLDEIDRTEATNVSPQGQLLAGSYMQLVSDELENRYSLIAADGELRITTAKLTNLGAQTGDVSVSRTLKSHRVKSTSGYRSRARDFTARNWYESPTFNPGDIEAEISEFISRNIYRTYSPTQPELSNAEYYHATIQAAGDVLINASQQINNSVIAPRYAYVTGGKRTQSTAPGSAYATYVTLTPQLPPDLQQKQVNPLSLPGFVLPQGENGLFRLSGQTATSAAIRTVQGEAQAATLNVRAVTVASGQNVQGPGATAVSAWNIAQGQVAANVASDISAINLPGTQSLPSSVQPPVSHKYLIETNPELTNLKQFLGSDYMLGKLGYSPDNTQKRLGDGLTRHHSQNGNSEYIRDFVDSAARIEAANSLSITAERDVTNLGSVLDSRGGLSITAGRDVTMASVEERHLQAYGSRYLNERVSQHGASATAAGDIRINAGRDLTAIASRIQSNADVALDAKGDVLIASAANESHFLSKSKKVTQQTDQVRQQASVIEAGGDVSIKAGDDLTFVASHVKAADNVTLNAVKDTNILSAKDESASFYSKKSKGSFGRSKSTQKESYQSTNIASIIEAGKDLSVNTRKVEDGSLSIDGGRDVTIVGSQLKAGNDLLLGASGDIAILSGVEEHGSYSKKTKSGFLGLSKSGRSQLKTTATQVASELVAANDVVIAAGNDVRIRASEATAGNDAEIRAGLIKKTGDINLVSANDTAYSLSEKYQKKVGLSSSGGFVSIASAKEAGKEAQSTISVGSQIVADRDAALHAERDINVMGSGISAGRNLSLDAGRDVNVVAAENSRTDRSWEKQKQVGVGVSADDNGVSVFAGSERTAGKERLVNETAAASQLEAGNDLTITAKRDINQTGSDLVASNDLTLQAGRDINIDAAREMQILEQQRSLERQGLGVSVNHNFGSTKDAAGNAGKGDNSVSQASGVLKAVDAISQFFSGPTADVKLGNSKESSSLQYTEQSNRASTLEAGNDVKLEAKNDVIVKGGQLDAGRDINIKGRDVVLDVARGSVVQESEQSQSWAGIQGGTSGGLKVGIGGSRGIATEDGTNGTSTVTQLNAGRDFIASATNDLNLVATQAQAGRDISLKAENNLNIIAAQNATTHETNRRSSGGEVGLAFGSSGIGVYASVNLGKGQLDREGERNQEAYLYAGDRLSFTSGKDTTVAGAQLRGDEIIGRVGGDLSVSSLADSGEVKGKEFDLSATVVIGPAPSLSGAVGYGRTTGQTNWVQEQTRITAKDRIDIRTENHTQLDGAVIASDSGNLKLDTKTLGFSDIAGQDKEHGYYLNVGGSYGLAGGAAQQDASQVGKGQEGASGWSIEGYNYERDREQIVRATVGEGEIVVRSDAETGKDSTAGLNRDLNKAYEITKDKEERTDLYVSKSSVEALSDPVATADQWAKALMTYDKTAKANFDDVGTLVNASLNEWEKLTGRPLPKGALEAGGQEIAEQALYGLIMSGMSRAEAKALLADKAFQGQVLAELRGISDAFSVEPELLKKTEQGLADANIPLAPDELPPLIIKGYYSSPQLRPEQVILDRVSAINAYIEANPEKAETVGFVMAAAQGPKGLVMWAAEKALSETPFGEKVAQYQAYLQGKLGKAVAEGVEDRGLDEQEYGDAYLIGGGGLVATLLVGAAGSKAIRAIKTSEGGAKTAEANTQPNWETKQSGSDSEFGSLPYGTTATSRTDFESLVRNNNIAFKDEWGASRVYDEVLSLPNGSRPPPSSYLSQSQIETHISKFDEGAVRFTSRNDAGKYGTVGPDGGFVLPKSEFDRVLLESNGNLRTVEKKLGLDQGYLGDSDTMAVYIKPQDMKNLQIPSGNEGGANRQWIPGGYTNGGVPEAVMDFSHKPPVVELKLK
jgi:filamentous hemagglutinin